MRKLYHTSLSPFCRKIRIHMREKGLDFELMEEPVWESRESLYQLNPAGEVPVLVDENDIILSGSYAISEYLEEGYTEVGFLGKTLVERAEVRRLVTWFDMKFYHEVSQPILFEKFYRRFMRYGMPDSETIRLAKNNISAHLDCIAQLTENRRWLAGDFLSLADFAASAHLSSMDYLDDVPWDTAAPSVREWYALLKSRPSFRPLLCDRMRGLKPPLHYENPDF